MVTKSNFCREEVEVSQELLKIIQALGNSDTDKRSNNKGFQEKPKCFPENIAKNGGIPKRYCGKPVGKCKSIEGFNSDD
ncbi:hypothetical protein PIROE2DRAFT_6345 [Piromyces sp. E2]|nr:hypothetical protein PIROE2DRAFT_6345 [Piromyces sp. E2]|eukprot:OUM66404.1 hypothetical protein PIROE2DRAFT_6345 [Piromyces sp. E2]